MDEDADNKNTASHGSPTRRKSVDTLPPPRSSPKMQTAQPLPMAHQHHQHNQHPQHHLPHHQYYANGQHLPSPDYRASPPGTASMSLPSIQHFEGAAVQAQPQYVPAAHMNGAPPMMHAPQYNPNMVQYPSQPMPPTMPSNAPNGHSTMMRYPIPPQAPMDSRNMSGGKHRKEIKRRTKSGCLTCRKRRIKVCGIYLSRLHSSAFADSARESRCPRRGCCKRGSNTNSKAKREACTHAKVTPLLPCAKANRYIVNSATRLTHHVATVKSQNATVWATIPSSRLIACRASNLRP
jgi:hypothetical protein